MYNSVKWVHMVENEEISSFLDGGEIVFTTGIGIFEAKDFDLLSLVKENIQNGASGMVVNVGPYIPEISETVIAYCNRLGFPLFVVPWEVKMARIIKVFCLYILEAEKYEMEISEALEKALHFPKQDNIYAPVLEKYGFHPDNKIRISVLAGEFKIDEKTTLVDELLQKINYITYQLDGKVTISKSDKHYILFSANMDEAKIHVFSNRLTEFLNSKLKDPEIHWAIGSEIKQLHDIHKSYLRVKNLLKINQRAMIFNPITDDHNLGAYELLMEYADKTGAKEYINNMIEPLFEYDRMNNTDLCVVLSLYLESNGRVNDVAQKLFVHRNTINYKIKKIENLLSCDLSDFFVRLNLAVAFMMKAVL